MHGENALDRSSYFDRRHYFGVHEVVTGSLMAAAGAMGLYSLFNGHGRDYLRATVNVRF
jgi:hypothetical protein